MIFDLLYETEYRKKLKCISFSGDFSHEFDIGHEDAENVSAKASPVVVDLSCKLLSPRKATLRSRIRLDFIANGNIPLTAIDPESGENTFYKTKELNIEKHGVSQREEFSFAEDISLTQSEKTIGEIISGSISVIPPQITVSDSSVGIKTNISVKMLYSSDDMSEENDEIISTVKTIPIAMTIDNFDIEEGKRVDVSLSVIDSEVSGALDAYGENRIFRTKFTALAEVNIYENVVETIAVDMYSPDFDSAIKTASAAIPVITNEVDKTFTVETSIVPEGEFTSPLFDTEVRVNHTEAIPAQGGINATGVYTITFLGKSGNDLVNMDFQREFDEFIAMEVPSGNYTIDMEIVPIDIVTTPISDGSYSMRIIFNIKARVSDEESSVFLSEVVNSTPKQKEKQSYGMVFYYPTERENLWDIAKRYSASPDRIKNANPDTFDEADNMLPGKRMIVIG